MTTENEKTANVSNPVEAVVMRQKRHKISNEHCVDFGEWQAWEECSIDDYNNVKALIQAGCNYEVRELVVKEQYGKSKLKSYQVGENDIVAAFTEDEARQILREYCGTELHDYELCVIELPPEMKLRDEEGNIFSTLGDYMQKVEKAGYLVGWE